MSVRKIIALLSIFIIASCGNEKSSDKTDEKEHVDQEKKLYTCPMHPEILRDAPGTCPICGMDLVEKITEGIANTKDSLNFLLKPTNEYALSQIKSIHPTIKKLQLKVDAPGKITFDPKEVSVIAARVSGRIEKLYTKQNFQVIERQQKLMDIYSKELVTEQENYIYLLNNDAANTTLIKAAENRLLLQGLTADQINELNKTKKSLQSITLYSPYSGHLHEMNASSLAGEMKSDNENKNSLIEEGMYVQKGQTLFNIYNTKKVWAVLSVYANQILLIKKGQNVTLTINGEKIADNNLTVDFIEPEIRAGQNTSSIRVSVPNTNHKIKIGSNVIASIDAGSKNGLFIPSSATMHLGNNTVVFIKDQELFKAQLIETGIESNGWMEIISGLRDTDIIAENAQLLMDSESFIKTGK
jgi:Cu(I)/Ag(I) efflux system membrane fusion protein